MTFLPLLDFFGAPLAVTVFCALFLLQWLRPLRRRTCSVWRRTFINFVYSLPGFALLRLTLVPIPYATANWAQDNEFGLLNWLNVPPLPAALLGIVLFDYSYYGWHIATHHVPLLWRFHNVHHTDLDLDVSTAARFHFGEVLLSVPFRVFVAALIGIAPLALLIFEICFECATQFHHSNWRLPLGVERIIGLFFITPRLHGIHHSIVRHETNSNWGTIFSFWDRLHRSRRANVAQNEITIGVPAWRDKKELNVLHLWQMPFGPQRDWRLPDGSVPEREE